MSALNRQGDIRVRTSEQQLNLDFEEAFFTWGIYDDLSPVAKEVRRTALV